MCDMTLFAERLGDLCGTSAESSRIIHPRHAHTAASMIIQCKSYLPTGLHKRRQTLNNAERQTGRTSFLRTVWTSLIIVFTDLFFIHAFPCKCERPFCVWNGNKCVAAQRTTTSVIERCKQQNNQQNCFQDKGVEGIKTRRSNIFSLNFDCLPTSLALPWHLTAMPFRPVKCYLLFLEHSCKPCGYLCMKVPLD